MTRSYVVDTGVLSPAEYLIAATLRDESGITRPYHC
jgi:hypothetical protein